MSDGQKAIFVIDGRYFSHLWFVGGPAQQFDVLAMLYRTDVDHPAPHPGGPHDERLPSPLRALREGARPDA